MHWARRGRWRRIPAAPTPQDRDGRLLDLGEEAGRRRFLEHYALVMGLDGPPASWGAESHPDPIDWGEILVPSHRGRERVGPPCIDVVIAVRGPVAPLGRSLWALLGKTGRPIHLVLVDYTRSASVTRFLHRFVARHPYVTLVSRPEIRRRWEAERAGLNAAGGDIVVLLESGAMASHGWLDGLVGCLEDDTACGMAGPLSNAAGGLQSFPHLASDRPANELPAWLTADGMALLLRGEPPRRPPVAHLDPICRAVRRDAIGDLDATTAHHHLDEQLAAAGHRLVVADDSYVHRPDAGRPLPAPDPTPDPLVGLRARVIPAMTTPASIPIAFRAARPQPLTVGFVMPNMAHGGSGGLHSVYQEASGLRDLGVDALILANQNYMEYARLAYDDADQIFVEFETDKQLERLSRGREVLIATHFKSVRPVAAVWARRRDFLPAYYVQDYEPFFSVNVNGGAPESLEARASYDLVEGMLLFAKTHWIGNAVGRVRALPVAKVEPSIDERLFTATRGCLRPEGPVRVLGMVRPRTWRRQPFATVMLLDRLKAELGDRVEVHSFGCTDEALELMMRGRPHHVEHHGVLTRQEVADRLKATDVFLDVSAFQGMGRTGFEAMCCGCTPVLPIIGGAHEYAVDNQNAVFVDTSDLRACYRELRALVLDPHRLQRLQQTGVDAGHRRSILAAVLSEYALIDHEHGRRFGRALEIGESPSPANADPAVRR